MSDVKSALTVLLDKQAIRELAMLYARAVDRKDGPLLRTLYTSDAVDDHGRFFSGDAKSYVEYLERAFALMPMSSHFICNHLISVQDDHAEGEVYALAYHVLHDSQGGLVEDFKAVRYIDQYRNENGRWLFANRVVEFDFEKSQPSSPMLAEPGRPRTQDPSYSTLTSRLFARGSRGPE